VLKTLNNWRYRLYPYLQNVALDLGLLDGHQDYERFIILGRSRSGSNFLRGLLNSHSQLVVLGEIFQNQTKIGWAYPGYLQTRRNYSLFLNDPIKFLDTKVFKKFPPQIAAVGFKIFYYHAQTANWQPIWNYLFAQKSLKVIHIKRRNILRTHLSRKLAAMDSNWVNTNGGQEDHRSVTLDYEECLNDFIQTREWEQNYDHLFEDHPITEVIYEDLAKDYSGEMGRLEGFLGVQAERVKPQTFKQSNQPLSQAISNFTELKAHFLGTPWESFFED